MRYEMKDQDVKNTFYGLATEIQDMTEEERLLSLERIVRAEMDGNKNRFWLMVSKKMLVNEEFTNKILLNEMPFLSDTLNRPGEPRI